MVFGFSVSGSGPGFYDLSIFYAALMAVAFCCLKVFFVAVNSVSADYAEA